MLELFAASSRGQPRGHGGRERQDQPDQPAGTDNRRQRRWFGDAQVTSRWPDGIRVALNGAGVLRGGRQDRDKENEG
jgi:hypothetical protein